MSTFSAENKYLLAFIVQEWSQITLNIITFPSLPKPHPDYTLSLFSRLSNTHFSLATLFLFVFKVVFHKNTNTQLLVIQIADIVSLLAMPASVISDKDSKG